MNKLYKIFLVFIIAIFIIPINNTSADVNKKNIIIGKDNKFTNTKDSVVVIDTKNLMPGDYIEESLEIKNLSKSIFNIKANCEEISENEEIYLLDKINITLIYEDDVLFQGKASDLNIIKNDYVDLGEIASGDKKTLKIIAELDGRTVGNEFQNKNGEFKINFYITEKYDNSKEDWNLPYTGGQNALYVIIISMIMVFIGYKFVKK